jgi:outer membrane protein
MMKIGVVIVIAMIACQMPANGFGLSYPTLEDPLKTKPSILGKGVTLPGDKNPISCSLPIDFSQPLAFDEAVDIALCNNPQIKSSWANIKIQAGALGEARSYYLPVINGSVNRTHDRTSYPGSSVPTSELDRNTYQGGLNWRLFDFGGRSENHKAALNTLTAALASHNAILQRALAGVTQAYFGVMTAKAVLNAAEESEKIAKETLASAKMREEKGAISQSDRLRATTALANTSLEYNRAQGDYRKAMAVLGNVLGLSGNVEILLPEEPPAEVNTEVASKDLNDWLEETQKNHPALVAARAQVQAARSQVAIAKSAGLPTLNFSGNYYRNTRPGEAVTANDTKEYTLGIGISIPLFDGFSNTYKIRGAQARFEQKSADLADTETQIVMELIKAYADMTSGLQNLDASANLLKAAQEALAVSKRRYDKGAADITEVLSTQSALSNGQRERIRCLAELQSAWLRLLANAGQLGKTAVHESLGQP